MEITISEAGPEKFEVRTDYGYFAEFKTMDDAANHSDGLAKGYNAAIQKLGVCHGWKRG